MSVVNQIISGIDFDKIQKCMSAVDWKWYQDEDGSFRVPTVFELETHARKLIEKVENELETNCLASGGFWVRKDYDNYITLQFVVDTSFAKGE